MGDEHHRRATVERLWRRNEGKGQAAHLAKWAKDGKTRRERKKRWAVIAEFARDRRLSKLDAKEYREAHKFKMIYRWARRMARRLKRKIKRERDPPQNTTAYGGSQAAGERVVVANAADYGAPITSRKRAASDPLSISNPSSDHNEANRNAYAWDLATFNGAGLAHSIARDLGISGYSTGNYNGYTINRPWGSFRVQILWAVAGHYNHVHVGIRRA